MLGPSEVAATVAGLHEVGRFDHLVWRLVPHKSSPKTAAEMNYGKVDGESPPVLRGMHYNKMYLYGTKVKVMTDPEHLFALYNSHSRELPFRVAKHKVNLGGFDFNVVHKLGTTTPAHLRFT